MRNMKHLGILLIVPLLVYAAVPSFHAPTKIQADGADIVVDSISDPFMVDWDGDGVKDLLVGQYTYGKVRFYKNTGTNEAPVFTFSYFLKADGVDISLSYG
jgi:hypothetical protein